MSAARRSEADAKVVRLHRHDNVLVARSFIAIGDRIASESITSRSQVMPGHKIASRDIKSGEPMLKYNVVIGFAAQDVAAGTMLQSSNIVLSDYERDYAFARDYTPTELWPEGQQARFNGFVRSDGRVGTRNYVGIISTVNCSATVVHRIADWFTPERLREFPNVDGVAAFSHQSGCGMEMTGEPMELLRRTLAGYARHPNFGAVVIVGLGCERNQVATLLEQQGLSRGEELTTLVMQEEGGTRRSVEAGIEAVRAMLPVANRAHRQSVPASHLSIGIIRDLNNPLIGAGDSESALAVLHGNLCPDGDVIKPSAANPKFLRYTGAALVFDSNAEMLIALDDPDLDVDENTVLVLRNGGPVSAPGMPEWGDLPIPKKLLQRGVRDMVRISDARMSGTHYGTCVLHVAPEAAIGGPLALLRSGDHVHLGHSRTHTEHARSRRGTRTTQSGLARTTATLYTRL